MINAKCCASQGLYRTFPLLVKKKQKKQQKKNQFQLWGIALNACMVINHWPSLIPINGQVLRAHNLPARHRCRIILVAPAAFLAPSARVFGVRDLRSCYRADVDTLAVGAMDLEARRAFLVWPMGASRLYPVTRVGTDINTLPDDVMGRLAMSTDTERVFKRLSRFRTKVDGRRLSKGE